MTHQDRTVSKAGQCGFCFYGTTTYHAPACDLGQVSKCPSSWGRAVVCTPETITPTTQGLVRGKGMARAKHLNDPLTRSKNPASGSHCYHVSSELRGPGKMAVLAVDPESPTPLPMRAAPSLGGRSPPEDFSHVCFPSAVSSPLAPDPKLIPALQLILLPLTEYLPGLVKRPVSKLAPSNRPRVSTGPRHPKQERGQNWKVPRKEHVM